MGERVRISTYDDGPFLVRGAVEITDAAGNRFPVCKETVALCRCGASTGSLSATARTQR